MRQLIRDKSLIQLINEFAEVQNRYNADTYKELAPEYDLKYKRVQRRLKKIKTGTIRYCDPCQYTGSGAVRIDELNGHSLPIVSFHKSAADTKYEMNTTRVEFDYIDFWVCSTGIKIEVNGLKGGL